MMRRFLALAVLAASAATSAADERILAFHSDITVAADGGITVSETIKVRCENDRIRHGIYRDFPVRYAGGWFTQRTVPFEMLEACRDGQPERFRIENKGRYKRVYLGREKVTLQPGVYTYVLTYRTSRQLGFFPDHDELYWNVTGNEWSFPIDQASVTVILPLQIPRSQMTLGAYTGPEGARGEAYTADVNQGGQVTFRTTRLLARKEGLTIVVSWPSGIIPPPAQAHELRHFVMDNPALVAGLLGLAVVLGYYLLAWAAVGRDPERGVVIPLFEPPKDLCPAAVRYVWRMGYDAACFAAACVSMAVKGFMQIEGDKRDYRFIRRDDGDASRLSPPEQRAAELLFRGGSPLPVARQYWQDFQGARDAVKKSLHGEYENKLFVTNTGWFAGGVVLSVLTLGGMALAAWWAQREPVVPFLMLWLTGWTFGTGALLWQVAQAWRRASSGSGGRALSMASPVGLTLVSVPFVAAEIVVMGVLASMTSLLLVPILVAIALLNVLFFTRLKRPTTEGRAVLDRIEGFQMYLQTAEDGMLRGAARPPAKSVELFERYLPYALALGCENAWATKFATVLAAAAVGAAGTAGAYAPLWYHGSHWSASRPADFASTLSASLVGALSLASTAPGSSSGSGGGGSSGGGGGGGGGGGW
ncbi:MAG: DUF2207 domain-containing protein [Phycisphaerae bacterium]|nr:DUF2207 domain-containing protein [Phycisphaerae bacterium]